MTHNNHQSPQEIPHSHDRLASMAVAYVTDNMVVGLGTGRAASRGIVALADKVKKENLHITCVSTSIRSTELAESLDLIVKPMHEVKIVDLLFDGADELTPDLAMTKGAGGAMTREKIIANASKKCIYMMDDSKLVQNLGQRFPLPVEFLDFGRESIISHLINLGLKPQQRVSPDKANTPYITDNGNPVLDCKYDTAEVSGYAALKKLASDIDCIAGVVGHGLFVDQADIALIESADGSEVECRIKNH